MCWTRLQHLVFIVGFLIDLLIRQCTSLNFDSWVFNLINKIRHLTFEFEKIIPQCHFVNI